MYAVDEAARSPPLACLQGGLPLDLWLDEGWDEGLGGLLC